MLNTQCSIQVMCCGTAPEAYIILLTSVTLIQSIKKEKTKNIYSDEVSQLGKNYHRFSYIGNLSDLYFILNFSFHCHF